MEMPRRVDVGGTSLAPDSSGFFNLAGAANDVPLPLLLALILLALLRAGQRRRPRCARACRRSREFRSCPRSRPRVSRSSSVAASAAPADTGRRPGGRRLRGRGRHRAHAHDGRRVLLVLVSGVVIAAAILWARRGAIHGTTTLLLFALLAALTALSVLWSIVPELDLRRGGADVRLPGRLRRGGGGRAARARAAPQLLTGS